MIRKNRIDYDCTIPIESGHCHFKFGSHRAGQPVGPAPRRSGHESAAAAAAAARAA